MQMFNDLLSGFTGHLKVKNYSGQSIAAYSGHLTGFFAWLEGQGIDDIKRVGKDALKAYQLHLAEHRTAEGTAYTSSTIAIKTRAIKRLFEYLEGSNQILVNPAEYLKEPKKEDRLPRSVLTEAEASKMLEVPNLSTLRGIRDRAILETLYSTGIRLEEITGLSIYDCDLQGGYLRVNKGKFAKDRVVPLGKHAVRLLKEYIAHVRPHYTKNQKATRSLFVNKTGDALSKQMIGKLVRSCARTAGIKKHVSPHTFRHSFATQLVKNGADITAVQKMLGHSDLSVTHIYTRVAGVDVKKTHAAAHPREKDKAVKEEITPAVESIRCHYAHS